MSTRTLTDEDLVIIRSGADVDWRYISSDFTLPEWFIEEFFDKVVIGYIVKNQRLSERMIKKIVSEYGTRAIWALISTRQTLSVSFIMEHMNRIFIPGVLECQELSDELRSELTFRAR